MILIVLFWTLFPFWWAFISSIKLPSDNLGNKWLPWVSFEPTLDPWRTMFEEREIRTALKNSAIIAIRRRRRCHTYRHIGWIRHRQISVPSTF